ncbi:MAG: cytochrome c-type biogenesis protein CcmH [Aggregatilineales bacterium]
MKFNIPSLNPSPLHREGLDSASLKMMVGILVVLMSIFLFALPLSAQESTPEAQPTRAVTSDDVNEVASGMFCPICENEPLDTCRANTCVIWRGEIRDMLEQGFSEQQVVDNFIGRFGQRVVDVPQDDGLRLLTFIGPIVLGLLALIVGIITFSRWRGGDVPPRVTTTSANLDAGNDDYRSQLESDLRE